MTDMMQAVTLAGPGRLELRELPVPAPGPGQVRVRVAGAGLCHSDLHLLGLGEDWPLFGTVLGHETAGYVDAVGAGVDRVAEGEAVLVGAIWFCGRCRPCLQGRHNVCVGTGDRGARPPPRG